MLRGEWWIDDDGNTVYADAGSGGDWDHESIAFYAALGLSLPGEDCDWPEELPEDFMCCRIKSAQVAKILLANGADPRAVAYFSQRTGTPDARKWAVKEMGWVRAVTTGGSATLEFWGLDDDKLRRIQKSDVWEEGDGQDVTLSNWETGWLGRTNLAVVLGAQSASRLIYTVERGLDGVRRAPSAFAGLMRWRR